MERKTTGRNGKNNESSHTAEGHMKSLLVTSTKGKRLGEQERVNDGNFLVVAALYTHGCVKCCHRHTFD